MQHGPRKQVKDEAMYNKHRHIVDSSKLDISTVRDSAQNSTKNQVPTRTRKQRLPRPKKNLTLCCASPFLEVGNPVLYRLHRSTDSLSDLFQSASLLAQIHYVHQFLLLVFAPIPVGKLIQVR